MKMRILYVLLSAFILIIPSNAHADIKQKTNEKIISSIESLAEKSHTFLAKAQELGFAVDEVRFEVSLTPKIEVYFRDTGDTGRFNELLLNASKSEEGILRMLQATRKFNVAHYSPYGIKLITGVAKPRIEILTNFIR